MKRPQQKVFIVEDGTAYAFDAVIKAQVSTSLKVAEKVGDVDKTKEAVNYATINPKKIEMQVSVSNTVRVSGQPLTSGGSDRAKTAYNTLVQIQERRNLLTVITPYASYTKMMIETLAIQFSEETQNEMRATVSFKQMVAKQEKKKDTWKDKQDNSSTDQSALYQTVDKELVGSKKNNASTAGTDKKSSSSASSSSSQKSEILSSIRESTKDTKNK